LLRCLVGSEMSTRDWLYSTVGGTPHLDGDYTVFGEVIEGLDIIDKIAAVQTDRADRPVEDVWMKMRIEK
ncbi:MAG: peptidylprolyl isomerase, partial [Bacteroidales bacterium]|nr:peptidylprolyl isomerase [Bacteroidales bacterium]